jgi:acyl carrier protein
MGLDAVELVMEVEVRFNVKLPDADCQRVRTVADLAALVVARLPSVQVGPCPTARAFFDLRRLMVAHAELERSRVRPRAHLDDLFPAQTRRRWNALRGHDPRLPRLVATALADAAMLLAAALAAFSWLMATAALWGSRGALLAVPVAMLVLAAGVAIFSVVSRKLATHFPVGLATVGDVARFIAPIGASSGSPGERLLTQQRVMEEVRRLTAEKLRLPLERVQPTSDFVKDLEID